MRWGRPLTTYKVLMVEDDDQAANTLSAHLERFGTEQGVRFLVTRLATAFDLSEAGALTLSSWT